MLSIALMLGVLPLLVVPSTASAATSGSCVGGAVQFSAHEDDDLLFMSPDIITDTEAGKCIRTVYVTAGDAGYGDDYWQSREKGSEAAWASMAGVSNSWTTSTLSAGGKSLRVRTLVGKPTVSLIFMRLPDGMLYGDGSDSRGSSVLRLTNGAISTLTAKDSSASYTTTTLKNAFLDILRASKPTVVRAQNYNGVYVTTGNSFDHWDHVSIAKVVQTVSSSYQSENAHRRIAYVGYPSQYSSANVSGTAYTKKSNAFDAYIDYDDEVDPSTYYDYYGWPARQYTAESTGATVAASAGPAQTAIVGEKITLDATGSYATGSMSYSWSLSSGPASVSLTGATSSKASFVPTAAGSYVFQVKVTSGSSSSTAKVTITVTGGSGNLALLSGVTATASSAAPGQAASAVIDGSTLGWPDDSTKEWSSVGGKAGSWVKLTFPSAVTTSQVVLYDRPNTNDQITGCTLTFSDGSVVTCPSALTNSGAATTINFTSRVTTSILLTVTSVASTTENIGLAEFQVFGTVTTAPVANAGTNQTTTVNQKVTLDGSASTGSGTLSYVWKQTSGTTVALSSTSAAKPTFTPTAAGTYVFSLTVTANGQSSTSSVSIQVSAVATANMATASGVTATASSGATNQTADKVRDGSTLGYPTDSTKEWASVGQKAGAWVQLTFPQPIKTDTIVLYDRPNTNDQVLSGTLTFSDGSTVKVGQLNNAGTATTIAFTARVTSSVKFTIDSVSTTTENIGLAEFQVLGAVASPPVANAGAAQSVAAGTTVKLNGSASSDPNGMALTYSWAQTGGTSVTLTNATTAQPTFTPTAAGTYTFQLTVNNGAATATATTTVTVTAVNKAPVANAGTAQSVIAGAKVTLDGSGSSDPDGDKLTYQWVQTSPSSPVMVLSDASAAKPTFTASTAGSYTFQLTVSDGTATSKASVTVTVKANTAPVANAGTAQTVTSGQQVTLSGTASDADGQTLTYSWVLKSGPEQVALANSTTLKPTFTPTKTGSYEFTFTVSDGLASASSTVTVTVNPPANRAPVANAGSDQSVKNTTTVTLDGSLSSDPDGNPITFEWSQVNGPATVTLSSKTAAKPTFPVTVEGSYVFELKVSDGTLSSTDQVTVLVGAANRAPVANAGSAVSVNRNTLVTLDGSKSTDADGDTLTYSWAPTSAPATVSLTNPKTAKPTFTPTVAGAYVFTLTVSDGTLSATSTVTVTVTNRAPLAKVGADQSTMVGTPVVLDGSGSSDPDGDKISYVWIQKTGPATASITGANTAQPTVTATTEGEYTFELTVSDGFTTAAATTRVTVKKNTAPVANAGAAQSVTKGATVTLDGSKSADADGQTLSYLWVQSSGPSATLSDSKLVKPTFVANETGSYVFKLTVSDGSLASDASVTITVTAPANTAPVASAGSNQSVLTGSTVTLDGSASKDPEGSALTYSWTKTSGPTATLTNATAAKPTFVASTAGSYVFTLTVSDGSLTSTASVTVTAIAPVNVAMSGATATASSQNTSTQQTAAKAIDGSAVGYPSDYTKEWATVGGKTGSWLKLTWSTPVTINRIDLFDRPNTNDRITSGTLVFSDGTSVAVTSLNNSGTATSFTFPTKTVTSVQLNITGVASKTENIGLAEIQVWGMKG